MTRLFIPDIFSGDSYMKAKIIKIGNSRGIRIPKTLMKEVQLQDEVLLEASRGTIVIRPARSARQEWSQAFHEMALRGEDKLLDSDFSLSSWDREGWEWK